MKNAIHKIAIITIYSTLFFSLQETNLSAQTAEDYKLLKQANKAYTDGQFQKAVEMYEKLVNAGFSAEELYYNLGNAYYRVGDYKAAILNYERAKLLDPDNEDIETNLEFSQRYVQDKIETVPRFFLMDWLDDFNNLFSEKGWAVLSIITFIGCLLLVISFLFTKSFSIKKLSFYFSVIVLFISLVSFYNSYRQNYKATHHNTAIVFSPAVTVKSSPHEGGTDLFIIHEGLKVTITDSAEGWKEIKLSDGKVGWLPGESIVQI